MDLLALRSISEYFVSSRAIAPGLTLNRPLDNFFIIHFTYDDMSIRPYQEITKTCILDRASNFEDENIGQSVIECLGELYEDAYADECVYAVVQTSCEKLSEQVLTCGRRSLEFYVRIVRWTEFGTDVDGDTDTDTDTEEEHDDEIIIVDEEEEKARRIELKSFLQEEGIIKSINDGDYASKDFGECAICLEGFDKSSENNSDEEGAFLPCSHVHHGDCLVSWCLEGKNTCPLCRSTFIN